VSTVVSVVALLTVTVNTISSSSSAATDDDDDDVIAPHPGNLLLFNIGRCKAPVLVFSLLLLL